MGAPALDSAAPRDVLQIVLLCADPALTGKKIAGKVGCNPATVSKWRQRFAEHRLDGLVDEPRPGATRTIGDDVVEQVVIRSHSDRCDALVDQVDG